MTSSRVMASSSPSASDLTRQSPPFPPLTPSDIHSPRGLGSMNMDDLLRNICGDLPAAASDGGGGGGKTVEEVWREISAGRRENGGVVDGEMTLEDFLAREGAGREEDVRVQCAEPAMVVEGPVVGIGNGVEARGGGRGRKRTALDPVDRAAMQRQKRMIKNRESAARSRERKQAYIAELEALVAQLEDENAQLLRHQEERHQKRLKQLMENLVSVTQRRKREKPPQPLRRTCSMEW